MYSSSYHDTPYDAPFKRVQSAVTSVSFPQTLKEVRNMGLKWVRLIGKDWITDMDVLFHFPANSNIPWIAPKWLTEGDILFFYHTKRARVLTDKLYRETRNLRYYPTSKGLQLTTEDVDKLLEVLKRAVSTAEKYSGTIFGFAEVSGRPQRIFDELKHFKGTIYAPLREMYIFEQPLRSEYFTDILKIGQNTTTPVSDSQFDEIKRRLVALNSKLPVIIREAKSGGIGFRDVNEHNWVEISCHEDTRFVNEAQIRWYFLDYLLDEIKDSRSTLHEECYCFRDNERTGRCDYFIRLDDRWVPVEAKLNVLVEQDLISQVGKYIHIDFFMPSEGSSKGKEFYVKDSSSCLVIDQAGIYLIRDTAFVDCSSHSPLFKREDLTYSKIPYLRNRIIKLLGM